MKQKEQVVSNTKIAVIFFAFLAFVLGISLIFKTTIVVANGQFDDSRRFTLALNDGKVTQIVSLSPKTKSLVVFKFKKNIKPSDAGRFLEIPIDGFIFSKSINLEEKISSLFLKTIPSFNKLETNFTLIDLLRLFNSTRGIADNLVTTKVIEGKENSFELDRVVSRLVSDDLVEKDNQTIKIINGTDIAGLGNRLARLLTNMGGDVIMVETSDLPVKKSVISYVDRKTYTVKRIQEILDYEVSKAEAGTVADVTITIGEDKIGSLSY